MACRGPLASVRWPEAFGNHTFMTGSTRRWLGVILLVAGVGVGVVLQLSSRGFLGLNHDTQQSQTILLTIHWSFLLAGALSIAGLLLLTIPCRKPRDS